MSKEIRGWENNDQAVEKLGEMIKDIRMAMFTTVDETGVLRSRPMATQEMAFDGDLWFYTRADTGKVEDVQHYEQVNVSYASPDDNRYVSIIGSAMILNDRAKMKELWNPIYKAWFPEGLEDPQLRLIKVSVSEAEYWDTPGGVVAGVAGFVKSVVTGKSAKMGDNKKVKLEDAQAT